MLSLYLDPSTEQRYEAQRWQTAVNSGLWDLLQRFPDDKKLARAVDTVQRELIKLQPTLRHRGLMGTSRPDMKPPTCPNPSLSRKSWPDHSSEA